MMDFNLYLIGFYGASIAVAYIYAKSRDEALYWNTPNSEVRRDG